MEKDKSISRGFIYHFAHPNSGVPAQEMMYINESGRAGLLKILSVHQDISIIIPVSV